MVISLKELHYDDRGIPVVSMTKERANKLIAKLAKQLDKLARTEKAT